MSVNNVDEARPPITVSAKPFEMIVPDDVVNASGSSAAIVANAVSFYSKVSYTDLTVEFIICP